ncbi:hypothetical protein L3Q82_007542 [Scortum barcoo]|uniref:Uncharacterized protein n=1 Tax=Scortum barcoo TaxID=214431 RepID=A0ACB8WPT8_9TELE|nr:hypothetical protein L3Q82_007542 [Scortum barcoo]
MIKECLNINISAHQVLSNGEPCILFQARKLSLRYEKQKQLDLTERAFSPQKPVDISQSVCRQDKATLLLRFGDVEDLRGLTIRLQLSNTFYESSGQWWFSVDSVSLLYNTSEEASFNASEVYAPSSSSYHCLHVSSQQRHSALLLPNTDHARRWAITFTNFQIQAFNITSGKFSPASDCATFLTPAILMGLITSLILLLVLAYALHMVIHLKHIEHDDNHKPDIYFPHNPEHPEHCCATTLFIKDYSSIVKPLTDLTSGYPPLHNNTKPNRWTDSCELAFNTIIEKLTTAPVLGFADPKLPYVLHTSASTTGLGAALYQEQEGHMRVIAYTSGGLSCSESWYPAHKLEILALKWAVAEKFSDYLYGNQFTVITGSNPLTYILTSAKLDATSYQLLAAVSAFTFKLQYQAGKLNSDGRGHMESCLMT